MLLSILSAEVLDDVRSAAWLEGELHPELDRHRRHEMADICEEGNIERVWRVLALCGAQVRLVLSRIIRHESRTPHTNTIQRPTKWDFQFKFSIGNTAKGLIREKIHEYMVAAVMADRTATIIPEAADVWNKRMEGALAGLSNLAATTRLPTGPARRPLYPF